MKNTEIAAKLLELAEELVATAVDEQIWPEKEQQAPAGLQLGKVYQRFGHYDSTVMSTVMSTELLGGGLRCYGFRKDNDGEVFAHGSTFGTVNEWQEVTDEMVLGKLARDAFAHLAVKEGDYLTVFWDGFDTKEKADKRRSDPSVIKVTNMDLKGFWPCVDGKSVSTVSKAVPQENDSYLFPAVFRKSTAEEIALYEEQFPTEPPVIISASGLQLIKGDYLYASCDKEYAKVVVVDAAQKHYCVKYFSDLDEVEMGWIKVGSTWDRSIRRAEQFEEALIESVVALHESETVK